MYTLRCMSFRPGLLAVLLILVVSLAQTTEAGLIKNETDLDASMMYLFWPIAHIPAHGQACVGGLIDFPYFVCGSMSCPIPFFTSGTTVRIYYDSSRNITCCRDCITNTCAGAKATGWLGEAFDGNDDGIIRREELAEEVVKAFNRVDADGDGKISGDEMAMTEDAMKIFDSNGDGALDRDETIEHMLDLFDRADTNGDGMIIQAELGAG